jgi:hypothetical protein
VAASIVAPSVPSSWRSPDGVAQQDVGRERRREASDFGVDGRGVEVGGRVEKCARVDVAATNRRRRRCGRFLRDLAQLRVRQRCDAADRVSLRHGVVQQAEAGDVGVRVQPSAIVARRRDGAVAPLPRAQRVDGDAGEL